METYYTRYIKDGAITNGKDFLKLCVKNFILDRGTNAEDGSQLSPIYPQLPNPYYKAEYDRIATLRDRCREMTFDEAKQKIIDNRIFLEQRLIDCKAEDEKYEKIRAEVVKWDPPTEEHERIKNFALEQLDKSFNTEYCKRLEDELNKELDINNKVVYEYIDGMNDYYEKRVEIAYNVWQKEIERANRRNLWVKQFLSSLEKSNMDSDTPKKGKIKL